MTDQTNHFRRVVILWFIASAILTPIVVLVLAPGMPPGNGTVQSSGQVADNTVLLGLSTPIALVVLVYLGYALWAFRERDLTGPVRDGVPIRGHAAIQTWWLVISTVLVLFLAGFEPSSYSKTARVAGRDPTRWRFRRRQGRSPVAGPGDRSAVGVRLPLPGLRRG